MIRFTVPGVPRGQQRARNDSRRRGKPYTPSQTRDYHDKVAHHWNQTGRIHLGLGPIEAWITAVHARPKNHLRHDGSLTPKGADTPVPLVKPDCDNVTKAVLDALNGMAFADDKQVAEQHFKRRWAVGSEQPHVYVVLARIEPQ